MSKAEEKALKEYPQNIVTDYNGSHDLNYYKRVLYQQGYHQAEKDLELSWEDIKLLDKIFMNEKITNGLILGKKEYEEILKRYKDLKK